MCHVSYILHIMALVKEIRRRSGKPKYWHRRIYQRKPYSWNGGRYFAEDPRMIQTIRTIVSDQKVGQRREVEQVRLESGGMAPYRLAPGEVYVSAANISYITQTHFANSAAGRPSVFWPAICGDCRALERRLSTSRPHRARRSWQTPQGVRMTNGSFSDRLSTQTDAVTGRFSRFASQVAPVSWHRFDFFVGAVESDAGEDAAVGHIKRGRSTVAVWKPTLRLCNGRFDESFVKAH